MTTKTKSHDSTKEMLDWQFMVILQQLDQIQLHASDDTCPCRLREIGEWCIPKHLNLLSSLAKETAAMSSQHAGMLFDLAGESTDLHLKTKAHVCGHGKDEDIVEWSRAWRKKIEPIYYSCGLKRAPLHDVAPLGDAAAPVRISGRCAPDSCTFKVSATKTTSASTSSIKSLDKIINDVMKRAEEGKTKVTKHSFAMGITSELRYEFEFKVVEADDLIVSNDPITFAVNPKYAKTIQPRERTRASPRLQVETIAANLNPDLLLLDFLSIDKGTPIVGPDLLVECGNGRVMGIMRAARELPDRYAAYKMRLIEVAPAYGLSADSISKMKAPVLVRVRITPVDRKAFAEECNARTTIQSSAIENAKTDAEKITPEMLNGLDVLEGESIEAAIRAARNKPFVAAFLGKLPSNEQAGLVDSKGVLSQEGVRRIVTAIFVATFRGDTGMSLGEKFFEATEGDVKNVFAGILRALGTLARAETMAQAGQRERSYAFGDDLAKVIQVYSRIKSMPQYTVAKYLAQQALEARELNPFQERLLEVIDSNARSAKRIGALLTAYAQAVIDSPPPGQAGFFAGAKLTKAELFEGAVKKATTAMVEDVIRLMEPQTCDAVSPKYRHLAAFFTPVDGDYVFLAETAVSPPRKIDQALAQLEDGVKNIQESDNFRTFLKTIAKFHHYSLGNTILIALQKPSSTMVAGFNRWKELGRFVKGGERGIMILAPCFPPKPKADKPKIETPEPQAQEKEPEKEESLSPVFFKVVYVFDISQTEGKPIATVDVPVLEGEDAISLYRKLEQLAANNKFQIDRKPQDIEAMGYWDRAGTIWVKPGVSTNQATKTLIHEITHALCETSQCGGPGVDAETIAESVAYCVGQHFGFDTGVRSFPYVAIWGKEIKVLKRNLDKIRQLSQKMIDSLDEIAMLSDKALTNNKIDRIITKIRKAIDVREKTKIWQSLDLPMEDLKKIVRKMVLSLPEGYYKLHDREYGTNIVDTMWEIYGWMPSMLVDEPMMLGLQALYPERVYASFTLGLDVIEIKAVDTSKAKLSDRTVFDDTYKGERFRYGLNYRPLGYAAVPPGWIIFSNRENPKFKFGTVDYPRKLTDYDVKEFQLTFIEQVAALRDYDYLEKRLSKCNLKPGELDRALAWKPLRDFITWALGLKKKVELCSVGMIAGTYQLTIRGVDALQKVQAAGHSKQVPNIKQVFQFGSDDLIYEVVVPQAEAKELSWAAQEINLAPARREAAEQAALFDTDFSKYSDEELATKRKVLEKERYKKAGEEGIDTVYPSEEEHAIYQEQLKRNSANIVEYNAEAIKSTGLNVGDKVYYFSPSWTGLGGITYSGVVVKDRHGRIAIKVDGQRGLAAINKGWQKIVNKKAVLFDTKPVCTPTQMELRERCIMQVKASGAAKNPYAVCTASAGCRPGTKAELSDFGLLSIGIYEGINQLRERTERKEGFAEARAYADKVGKPLLVVGTPKAAFNNHPCGDVTIDINPKVDSSCNYKIMDVRDIKYSDKHFGAAFISHVLEHLPTIEDAIKALNELHRVADKVFVILPHKSSIAAWLHPEHELWLKPIGDGFEIEQRRTHEKVIWQPPKAELKDPELDAIGKALRNTQVVAALSDHIECGFCVCQDKDGKLSRGPASCGDEKTMTLNIGCLSDNAVPVAIAHNHPSQIPVPSKLDLDTAKRFNIAVCVKTNAGVNCFRAKE